MRIHVNGGRTLVRISPLSLAPHHSGPATRDIWMCMVPYTKKLLFPAIILIIYAVANGEATETAILFIALFKALCPHLIS